MLGNPLGSQSHFTGPAAQGNLFGGHVTAHAASASFESPIYHRLLPPPEDSNISVFTPNSYPIPRLSLPSPSETMYYPHSYPSETSSAAHFQYDNDNPWMRKRHHPTNLECGPERKRVRQNLSEERNVIHPAEFHPSRRLASPDICLPSFKDSFPPPPEAIVSPSVPGSPATSSDIIREPESGADWSITYNTEVKREVDVSVVRPLDLGLSISCLKFSKDGKYLAVGFEDNGINIYDMQTADKTWLVFDEFLIQDYADQSLTPVH
jgi:WD40 repeat protein